MIKGGHFDLFSFGCGSAAAAGSSWAGGAAPRRVVPDGTNQTGAAAGTVGCGAGGGCAC